MTENTQPAPGNTAPPPDDETVDDPSEAETQTVDRPPRAWVQWLVVAVVVALAFLVGRAMGGGETDDLTAEEDGHAGHEQSAEEHTCAMHPQIRMSNPGQCPICGMDLVPAGAERDDGDREGRVELSADAKALAKIRTTEVIRSHPQSDIRLLGRVEYDETRLRTVTSWVSGRIDRLSVRVTGSRIGRGKTVATVYSPDVYAGLRDLVQAKKQAERLSKGMHGTAKLAKDALESSRERLRLLGVPQAIISQTESSGKPPKKFSIRSPFGGTVVERLVEEGAYVETGSPLLKVVDLTKVWVQIDAYESDLPHIRVGDDVLVEVVAYPDEPFEGHVAFIEPVVSEAKRTARVRVEVDNGDGRLRPGMFAETIIRGDSASPEGLVVPATAPLFTGRRSVVYVEVPRTEGLAYELREVRLGARSGNLYPVLSGLSAGERVVTRGAFVLDAELQLQGGRAMMTLPDDTMTSEIARATPAAFLAALTPIVKQYLDTQQQLASDELAAARTNLETLATLANAKMPAAPPVVVRAWQQVASDLAGHASHGAKSTSDGDLRNAFEEISKSVLLVLRQFGNPTDEKLRVAFCPMAFDSRGAAWIQRDHDLANPYYGAGMLRCGEFRESVDPGTALASQSAPPPAAASGHQH